MEQSNNTYKIVIGIVIVLLIILGIYSFTKKPAETYNGDTKTNVNNTPAADYSLVVDDQFPGTVVYVSTASLKKAGYVVIHKETAGKPGAVIGSKAFSAGTNPGQVDLSEATIEGMNYYAMIHEDNGDGKFDAATDMVAKDKTGMSMIVKFKATTKVVEQKG